MCCEVWINDHCTKPKSSLKAKIFVLHWTPFSHKSGNSTAKLKICFWKIWWVLLHISVSYKEKQKSLWWIGWHWAVLPFPLRPPSCCVVYSVQQPCQVGSFWASRAPRNNSAGHCLAWKLSHLFPAKAAIGKPRITPHFSHLAPWAAPLRWDLFLCLRTSFSF